jgi:hypothetical protein
MFTLSYFGKFLTSPRQISFSPSCSRLFVSTTRSTVVAFSTGSAKTLKGSTPASSITSGGEYNHSKVSPQNWNLLSHRSAFYLCSVTVTIITVTWIGGLPFFIVFLLLLALYFEVARVYGQTARDMRRLGMRPTLFPLLN